MNFQKSYRSAGRISEQNVRVKRGIMNMTSRALKELQGLMGCLATRILRKILHMILFHPKTKVYSVSRRLEKSLYVL